MATLYIDRKNLRVESDGAAVKIQGDGEGTQAVPMTLLDRVVITADARVSCRLLRLLGERGIAVVILNPRHPEQAVELVGGRGSEAGRRIRQYALYQDEGWRRRWSARLIGEKLKNQRLLLARAHRERKDLPGLLTACRRIEEIMRQLEEGGEPELGTIMGWEGAAAAAYFGGYAELFPAALGMHGRNRRPPRDPVNVCLSLGYTLMHTRMVATLAGSGLDPYVGFYHGIAHGRESLAADLIEILRPRVDGWVWRLFRERLLRAEHFKMREGRRLMGKAGRRTYYGEFETLMPELARHQRRLCRLVLRALGEKDDGEEIRIDEAVVRGGEEQDEDSA